MRLRYTISTIWLSALLALAGACSSGGQHEPTADNTAPTDGADDGEASSSKASKSDSDSSSERAGPESGSAGTVSSTPTMVAPAAAGDSAPATGTLPSGISAGAPAPGPSSSGAAGGDGSATPAAESAADEGAAIAAPPSDDEAGEPPVADADGDTDPTEDIAEPPEPEPPRIPPQAGSLTAGVWDDNRNFDRFSSYRSDLLQNGLSGALPFEDGEHASAHERFAELPEANTTLDISLVVDTTGSMGDEIAYLQTEFQDLSATISKRYPNSEQRWSLIVYRDRGDAYLAEAHDFDTDVEAFRETLSKQSAGGGGDYPEAPDEAFARANELSWRDDADTARIIFWVADAPHHNSKAETFADQIRTSVDQDIHIYPVASSGVDELTELTMRSAAQLSGGRYIFLTDDSGLGGAHKEPTIPCYFVTRLDQAILRMVEIELSGEYREPEADDIIRTGGDPEDGACELDSGDQANAF